MKNKLFGELRYYLPEAALEPKKYLHVVAWILLHIKRDEPYFFEGALLYTKDSLQCVTVRKEFCCTPKKRRAQVHEYKITALDILEWILACEVDTPMFLSALVWATCNFKWPTTSMVTIRYDGYLAVYDELHEGSFHFCCVPYSRELSDWQCGVFCEANIHPDDYCIVDWPGIPEHLQPARKAQEKSEGSML